MMLPGFEIPKYGVFDSNVKFPRIITTQKREVDVYELEFYTSDWPGVTYIDGRSFDLCCGRVVCAKPGQIRNSRLPFKCYYFHLETGDEALRNLLDRIPDCFVMSEMQELTKLLHEMLMVETAELPEELLLLESCVCRIICLMAKYAVKSEEQTAVMTPTHQKALLEAEKYIREHLAEDLSLSILAGLFNLSPGYFHRLFTQYFGKTPNRYILDCRIAAAKTGLLTGDYSLSELAADCGFSSQSYFTYKFREATGKTPMEYRKEMLSRLKI